MDRDLIVQMLGQQARRRACEVPPAVGIAGMGDERLRRCPTSISRQSFTGRAKPVHEDGTDSIGSAQLPELAFGPRLHLANHDLQILIPLARRAYSFSAVILSVMTFTSRKDFASASVLLARLVVFHQCGHGRSSLAFVRRASDRPTRVHI
ncbi:MAG: hypothetical protein ACREV1_15520 [Gammaproteobacteria bacterium]